MAKQNQPVISVVILTRETPFMILKRCIQSIREQTYKNIEILLLDSNEKDSPYKEAILAEADFLTDIIHLEIPETKEFVHGKNAVLDAYHGDYLTFLSSQDIMPAQRIEKIIHAFKKKTSYQAIYTDLAAQQNNILESTDYELLSTDFQYLSQLVLRRDCFQWIGIFDPDLVAHCDDELWFRIQSLNLAYHLSSKETIISVCPDAYHNYSSLDAAIGYRQLCIKYEPLFKKNKAALKVLYQKAAEEYKKAGVIHRYLQFALKAKFFFSKK